MNKIDYVIKLVMFEVFFWLWGAPLVFLVTLLPTAIGPSGIDRLFRASVGLVLILWFFVASSWLAAHAARRSTYEYESPVAAVRFAINEARLRLAFVPVLGIYLAPKREPSAVPPPIEPKL